MEVSKFLCTTVW